MKPKHLSFCLEQQYGHIIPTLGIAIELMRRGWRVTYAVTEAFAPVVQAVGAEPVVLRVLENREQIVSEIFNENDHLNYKVRADDFRQVVDRLMRERTDRSKAQLEDLYRDDRPDLIVRDDIHDRAGRDFAKQQAIPSLLLRSQYLGDPNAMDVDEPVVLVTVPLFFQPLEDRESLPNRFKCVGFLPEGRSLAFKPWKNTIERRPSVLVSPTTGLFQQVDFCKTIIEAFRDTDWQVILSISGSHDTLSAFEPEKLGDMPRNVQINRVSSNFDILPDVDVYIGQGGQGGVLEAIYHGVPQIVIPPTPYHYLVARRVVELGLGACVPLSELSSEVLIQNSSRLLGDLDMHERVKSASIRMRECRAAMAAADLIEGLLKSHAA